MEKYHSLMTYLANRAKHYNIDDWEMFVLEVENIGTRAFKHEIIKESSKFYSALSIRVIKQDKEGISSSQLLSTEEIDNLLERACDNLVLYDKEEKPLVFDKITTYPKLEENEELNYTIADIKQFALNALENVYKKDSRVIDGSTCSAEYGKRIRYYASSKGIELIQKSDDAYIMSNCKVSDGNDIQNAYSVKEGNIRNSDVTDGVNKAIKQLNPKKIKSGCYDVIFSPDAVSQILETFVSIFSGKKSAFSLTKFKDKEEHKVASDKLTIIDDPLYPGYRLQCAFDDDGYPCYTKTVIENGVLKTLLYNLEYGAKCGKSSTGNGYRSQISGVSGITPYSFYIKPSNVTLDELFQKCEGGIYVTQMKGFHAGANAITGDFSIESAGFLIKDSKADEAINEFTVSGNFYELLENIEEVANDLEFEVSLSAERFGSPSILVKGLSISGK